MSAFRLLEGPEGLSIQLPQLKRPFSLSFDGQLDRRARQGGELLWRATGAARPEPPLIIDATAGLCRDAFLLASAGAQVIALEREPLLYQLCAQALERDESPAASRVELHQRDALETLSALGAGHPPPELASRASSGRAYGVVYLDPMFPSREKSAAVSREAQVLRALTHQPEQSEAQRASEERLLLELALSVAYFRVVVKRPIKAAPLPGRPPSAAIKGRAIRYDIYGLRSFK